jgi:hypothetical protein
MKKALMAVSLILVGAFCYAGGAPETETTPEGYTKVEADDFELQWKVDGDLVHFRLSAPTTGWVSVGFDPSQRMKDANYIIGYVDASGAKARDDFGMTTTSHAPDEGTEGSGSHVTGVEGSEANGRTELRFTIPLDSGDSRDSVLVPGQKHTILLAYGPDGADDFSTIHRKRTSFEVVF